ncbi:UDP-N-acetylglucosamine--N-acetylmuramyl-(pentapeptide) pyrophosphoryl-undecaprenol N-acetylglucosamine transferase [bacterium]|nr:MAG: UDP-N-acetylglucosamine--N-acetylmuramyl-(pentapeptide) pyrophosphoryl-undecaprenol N-acetylglucosamine transferase [bacterium]
MKIFLVGGGTGGPTAPVLSVAQALRRMDDKTEFFFIGTKNGLEKKLLSDMEFPVTELTIPAGKWRRYFSLLNFTDLFKLIGGFFKSIYLIRKYSPDAIFGAGSFVQVPVAWAGYFLKIPVIVHQQDFDILLSTRLVFPTAKIITTAFSYSGSQMDAFSGLLKKEKKSKIVVTGNPVRKNTLKGSKEEAKKLFSLRSDLPTVLIMGGGAGSAKINALVADALPELTRYVQIIHITGGKAPKTPLQNYPEYHPYAFLGKELAHAFAAADLVVSRGGMSTITEIGALGKPSILIPLPKSQQIDNVRFLAGVGAAIGVPEQLLTSKLLVEAVRKILWNPDLQKSLSEMALRLMPRDADVQIAKQIFKFKKTDIHNGNQ